MAGHVARVAWAAARGGARDKAHQHAAALAYYTLFALGPVLYLALAGASLVLGEAAARGLVLGRVDALLGQDFGRALDELLRSTAATGPGLLGTALGLVALAVGAMGAFAQLRDSLNAMWGLERREGGAPREKAAELAHHHSLSLAGVVGTVLLVAVALLVAGGLGSALVGVVLSTPVLWLVLLLTYRFLPDAHVATRDAAAGAAAATLLLLVAEVGMWAYVRVAPEGTLGVAGALLVLLLWLYVAVLLVLYGAEYAQAHARTRGRDVEPDEHARPRGAAGLTPKGRRRPSERP